MMALSNWLTQYASTISCIIFLEFCLASCSSITGLTIDTMQNEALYRPSIPIKTPDKGKDDVFIGIAMSGGGSRASNFSGAVLLELEKLGILQHTDVISSVSGSSLTAAYYGLYGNNKNTKHQWNEQGVRKAFLTDFQSGWIKSWFNPWHIMQYWLTNFTRSDIMIEKLNDELYEGKKFKELLDHFPPQVLINSTSYTNGEPFIFTEEQFADRLNSRLDTFPVANAVMASSAFPGVFHPVTVKDYSVKNNELVNNNNETQNYEHLIDGGPNDNLGITAITNVLQAKKTKHCLLLIIDAYPYAVSANGLLQADTRNATDFIFDAGSVLSSTDVMLAKNRSLILEKTINYDMQDIGFKAYNPESTIKFSLSESGNDNPSKSQECTVWHLSFQRLYDLQFEWSYARRNVNKLQYLDRLRKVVNSIPTRYRLEESNEGDEPETVQDYIFKAAHILVKEDRECNRRDNECNGANDAKLTYQKVCDLLKGWGLRTNLSCNYK